MKDQGRGLDSRWVTPASCRWALLAALTLLGRGRALCQQLRKLFLPPPSSPPGDTFFQNKTKLQKQKTPKNAKIQGGALRPCSHLFAGRDAAEGVAGRRLSRARSRTRCPRPPASALRGQPRLARPSCFLPRPDLGHGRVCPPPVPPSLPAPSLFSVLQETPFPRLRGQAAPGWLCGPRRSRWGTGAQEE